MSSGDPSPAERAAIEHAMNDLATIAPKLSTLEEILLRKILGRTYLKGSVDAMDSLGRRISLIGGKAT